jgi:uncharacterized integral membrane protein
MFRNIVFFGLMAVVLLFVVQNMQVVEFQFLVWNFAMSRALMLFATLAVGIAAGWLLAYPKRHPRKQKDARK